MQKKALNTKGFGLIEVLIVVVVLALVAGGGAYVYHKNHKAKPPVSNSATTKTTTQKSTKSSSDVKTNASASSQSAQKYLTISEWGVRVAYSGDDTLSYKIDDSAPNVSSIISANL